MPKTFCPLRSFEEAKDNEARILCPLELTAKGDFIPMILANEFTEEDKRQNQICSVNDDILSWINCYNLRFPHCIEFEAVKQSILDKRLRTYGFKRSAEILLHNLKNIENSDDKTKSALSTSIATIKTLESEKEKWEKHVTELDEYIDNTANDDDEISFEPTDDEVMEIFNELIDLRKKGAAAYLKKEKHRQPTEEEIQNEIAKLYRGYERILDDSITGKPNLYSTVLDYLLKTVSG